MPPVSESNCDRKLLRCFQNVARGSIAEEESQKNSLLATSLLPKQVAVAPSLNSRNFFMTEALRCKAIYGK